MVRDPPEGLVRAFATRLCVSHPSLAGVALNGMKAGAQFRELPTPASSSVDWEILTRCVEGSG
jgi:hypothetical protein